MIEDTLMSKGIKLLRLIGEGGEAKVYEGVIIKSNRPVAVKILKGLETEATIRTDLLKRFHQELEIWSKLRHPNIVRVFPLKNIQLPVIIMEKCDKSLRTMLVEKGKIP